MKKQKLFGALVSLLVATPVLAATQYAFKQDVGQVRFEAQGRPKLITINGDGKGVRGSLTQEGDQMKGELEFDLGSLETHLALRDRHMKEKYLQVQDHPVAKLTEIQITIPATFKTEKKAAGVPFTAMLTLHGEKKPVKDGKVNLEEKDGKVEIKAEFPLKLSEHKIDIPSFAGVTVAEDIKVFVATAAEVQSK